MQKSHEHVTEFIATVGGAGHFPVAPGTIGSAVGLGIYLLLPTNWTTQLVVVGCTLLLGIWSAGAVAVMDGDTDPSRVVIDEVVGMLIACFLLPKSTVLLCLAFLGFRLFDIGKWFPMRQLERLPGGLGIVADDAAAGLLTRFLLLLLSAQRGLFVF